MLYLYRLGFIQKSIFLFFVLMVFVAEVVFISKEGLVYGFVVFPLLIVFPLLYLSLVAENQYTNRNGEKIMVNMYRFIFKVHRTQEDGEEYVVAESSKYALDILNKFYEKDDFFVREGEVPVEEVDKRSSLSFKFGESVRVSRYIKEHPYEHFVGSTSPNMAVIQYMLDSK